jgi:hypothetical protein
MAREILTKDPALSSPDHAALAEAARTIAQRFETGAADPA